MRTSPPGSPAALRDGIPPAAPAFPSRPGGHAGDPGRRRRSSGSCEGLGWQGAGGIRGFLIPPRLMSPVAVPGAEGPRHRRCRAGRAEPSRRGVGVCVGGGGSACLVLIYFFLSFFSSFKRVKVHASGRVSRPRPCLPAEPDLWLPDRAG